MKFTIDRDILMDNLNIIARTLPSKTPLPILMCFKLELDDNQLVLTSSNSDISVMVSIDKSQLEIEKIGYCVVPGKYFIEFVRKITCKKISVALLEDKILTLQSDRGEYNFKVEDYDDYPTLNFINMSKPLSIKSNVIKSIVKQTSFAASTVDKKPIFTGVNMKKSSDRLVVTATDSFRLSQSVVVLDNEFDDFEINIPNKSIEDLSKSLDYDNEEVEFHFEANKALFKFKNILFQTRLLDGDYPNTSRLIPDNFNIEVAFNKDELINAVERVSLLSPKEKERNELTYSIVKLEIKNDKSIEISSTNSLIGEAKEMLISTTNDIKEVISISFSSRYIIEALRSFSANEVVISLVNNFRTFIIRSTKYDQNIDKDDNLLTQLILPVRTD